MEFENLLHLIGDEPLFESSLLLAGEVNPNYLRLQLSRWVKSGRIVQLRRGLYALAPPYQKTKPHPFVVANRMVGASYVSCQSALSFYDLIPENLSRVISITGKRPGHWDTPLGAYHFRHIKPEYLRGYQMTDLGAGQQALVATPEKALLDLIYLQPNGDEPAFLAELRLQNLSLLDLERLHNLADIFSTPKLARATHEILALVAAEQDYETL